MNTLNEILLLTSFLLASCTSGNLKEMKMETFPIEKKLIAERIPLKEVLSPGYLLAKKDYLFVTGEREDTMLYQYSIPTLSHVQRFGTKGQGGDDFQLFPMFAKSHSADIYIWGYTPLTIKRFSINEYGELIFKNKYTLLAYESFNGMHIIKDSLLIYSAIPNEFAIKKVDLNTGKVVDKRSFQTEDHQESFFYSNRGYVAANDSFIVYPYVYKKQIDIYRVDDLSLSISLIGEYKPKKIVVGDFENNRNYYLDVVAGKNYFYALCKGETTGASLEVFDYEGHSVARYNFDIVPYLFEVDEDRGYLYGYNNELEDYLLRYNLEH